ncbi:hypothetical protein [Pararhodobacter sp.]|uniref:hypothetical protein n=1 Tax=Pararhodobacter sp. TaxID=2127056 RepID=UPI002FDDE90C
MKPCTCSAAALRSAAVAAVLTSAIAVAPALAQDLQKDDWSFNFFNDSSYTVTEFRVAEMSGAFGHNWLGSPMAAGHGLTLEFSDPLDTRCEVLTRVVFHDGSVFDGVVNYCGTAIVRATNDWLYFE